MNKKYELVPQEDTHLFRIRALRDFNNIKAGDLGGFVATEDNLSHDENCWVYDSARVYGNAQVFWDAQVHGNAQVYGDAHVYGDARVYDDAQVYDDARVYSAQVFGSAQVYGDARVYDNAQVYVDAQVFGSAQVFGPAQVFGNAQVYGDARVYHNAQVYGSAHVYGNARVYQSAQVYGSARVYQSAQVFGNAQVYGDARVCERQWIRFGYYKKHTLVDLLRCSLGVHPTKNGFISVYKRVNIDYTSEHDKNFVYPLEGLVEAKEYNPDPSVSCGTGLHFSTAEYWPLTNENTQRVLIAKVHLDDIIACQEGKIRVKRAEILG